MSLAAGALGIALTICDDGWGLRAGAAGAEAQR